MSKAKKKRKDLYIKPNIKSKKVKKKEKIIVDSPFQTIDFYQDSLPTTLADIFLNNYSYYAKMTKNEYFEFANKRFVFKLEVVDFLNNIEFNSNFTENAKEKKYFLKNKWQGKNNQFGEAFIEKDLYIKTHNKEVIWEEQASIQTYRNVIEKYTTFYRGVEFLLEVNGVRKAEDKMMGHIYLSWKSIDKKTNGNCENIYNSELYKSIKEQINSKRKEEQIKNRQKIKCKAELIERKINNKDFLVKTNLFRCFFKEHVIQEILGIVKVLTPYGEIKLVKVPAAYCEECNCYYILKSEFDKICEEGVILCQVLRSKIYYEHGLSDLSCFGSGESVLKINGYNVIASQNLSDIQRKMILKNIMDNNILLAHNIASYLDTFISMKLGLPQYNEAIKKWTEDKEFVLHYKNIAKIEKNIEVIKL